LRLLVEKSSKVAPYVQVFGGYLTPKWIRSVCLCCVMWQCHQDIAVFCFVHIILKNVRNILIIFYLYIIKDLNKFYPSYLTSTTKLLKTGEPGK